MLMSKKYKICLILIVLFLSINSIIIISSEISDPFYYRSVAFIEGYEKSDYNNMEEFSLTQQYVDLGVDFSNRPGFEIILYEIFTITAIDVKIIQFLPIGLILFGLSLLPLINRLPINTLVKFTIFIIPTIFLVQSPAATTFVHSWSFILFTLFLLTFLKYLEGRTVSLFITMLFLFVGNHIFYYTAEVWMLSFSLFLFLFVLIYDNKYIVKNSILTITIILSSVFLYFNNMFYQHIIPSLTRDSELFSKSMMDKLGSIVGISRPTEVGSYLWVGTSSDQVHALFLAGLVIALVLLMLIILILFQLKIRHNKQIDVPIALSIISVAGIDYVGYVILGCSTAVRFILLFFPFVVFLISTKVLSIRTNKILCVFLIVLSILTLFSSALYSDGSNTTYVDQMNSSGWLFNHSDESLNILGDFRNVGIASVYAVDNDIYIYPIYINNENYVDLIENEQKIGMWDYSIISLNNKKPVESTEWMLYQPFQNNSDKIITNNNIIFNDHNHIIAYNSNLVT